MLPPARRRPTTIRALHRTPARSRNLARLPSCSPESSDWHRCSVIAASSTVGGLATKKRVRLNASPAFSCPPERAELRRARLGHDTELELLALCRGVDLDLVPLGKLGHE